MTDPKPESLIGKRASDPLIRSFVDTFGETPRLDSFAGLEILEYPQNGLALYLDSENRVASVFFYGIPDEDHGRYTGALPYGLSFADGQVEVAQKLGSPEASGYGQASNAPWERFKVEEAYLHIEYSLDCTRTHMVTLMSDEMAEGRFPGAVP